MALSGGFIDTARPFMPHRWLFTRPTRARTTPTLLYKQPPLRALPFQADPHKLVATKSFST
ncbi:hypothetical protein OIU84_021195 [Salix udensis]|uniref:Uncharacterized protein n=1 Tax=Salix udensis TaxID=889485 RepID=A0AAD6KU57_9ROSI|nr:hypothetical protein OIU84_021195 [Salix udensis]